MIIPESRLFSYSKELRVILILLLTFFVIRISGVSISYYQDEWKNVSSASSVESAGAFFAHPPLMQMWFVAGYAIFGENNFRLFPILFSAMTLVLLYIVVRKRCGNTTALLSASLFTVVFYSIWGSLMVDVDGPVMPLLFLLAVYCYDESNLSADNSKRKWFILLLLSCLAGFLIKLSFILVVGVFLLDYVWTNWRSLTLKKWVVLAGSLGGFGIIYVVALYVIQAIYPAFSIDFMLGHANQFVPDIGRDYTQIVVQGVKAIYYLSPLLIVPLLFLSKEIFRKTRIFFIYLLVGFLFYFVIFDFSRGVLDKYLIFATIPLAVISGAIFASLFKNFKPSLKSLKIPIIISVVVAVILIAINFLPHAVMPLYPKTEWFSRVLHGQWNFLNPFNGGSGPIGFYVSFLFIAVSFIFSAVVGLVGLIKKDWRQSCAIILIAIGLVYNIVLAEELMFGKINGNSTKLLATAVSFITKTDSIKKVMSYNSIGIRELSPTGKWYMRFYAAPQFESNHRKVFADFKGQYLVVDIPHISESIFYGKFLAKCDVIFESRSGKITARVYDCLDSKKIIDSI
jgi:4-amino-4-deoxy-L-arabinose transferase-like glycosyltransferase